MDRWRGRDSLRSSATARASDYWGNALIWSGGGGWARTVISEGTSDLDCVGTWCLALDAQYGTWRTGSAGVWAAARAATPVGSVVQCASSARCFTAGDSKVSMFSGSGWQSPTRLPADLGAHFEVGGDCPTSSFCLLVGSNGHAVTWNGSSWRARGTAPGIAGPVVVDCVSTSFCMVAGESKAAVFDDSAWHAVSDIGTRPVLSCVSSTRCYAIAYGTLRVWDGAVWNESAAPFAWTNDGSGISCTSPTRCVAIVDDRVWYSS